MGYNQYMCVVCRDVEDNGWDYTNRCCMVMSEHIRKCKVKNLADEWCEDYGTNYDVCTWQ
jgi:hypothetical protein